MDTTFLLGLVAGFLTTLAFIPQVMWNAVTLILTGAIVAMKLKFR